VNPAYKHIRDRLRIGELTIPQIAGMFAGLMGGLVFALYLTPFGAYPTLFLAIYIASIPTGAVLLASSTEFDLWLYLRACVTDYLSGGRYIAGPGAGGEGYVIEPDENAGRPPGSGTPASVDLEAIWEC
jgi:hypothetical protein